MSSGAKIALAVAAGYCLGRHRKLRLAAAVAAAGVAGRWGASKSGLLEQGMKGLNSPELEEITGRLRGDLREAGKAAAVAATSRQIDALSDAIHARAEALRDPGRKPGDKPDKPDKPDEPGEVGDTSGRHGEPGDEPRENGDEHGESREPGDEHDEREEHDERGERGESGEHDETPAREPGSAPAGGPR